MRDHPSSEHRNGPDDISNKADVKPDFFAKFSQPTRNSSEPVSLSNLDAVEIPNTLSESTHQSPTETEGLRDEPNVLAVALDDASKLAIEEAIAILRMYADPENDDTFGIVTRAKCAVIGHVFNAKLRVSEESFRQQRFNRLPELLKLIAEEERLLPVGSLQIEIQ